MQIRSGSFFGSVSLRSKKCYTKRKYYKNKVNLISCLCFRAYKCTLLAIVEHFYLNRSFAIAQDDVIRHSEVQSTEESI